MKITRLDGPTVRQLPASTTGKSEARERAIKILEGKDLLPPKAQAVQTTPVQNPTSVSPEELSAIKPSTQNDGQIENNVATQSEGSEVKASESPAPAKQPEESKEDSLSAHMLLARKEKALRAKIRQQEQAVREKEAALAAKEAELAAKQAEYTSKYIPKDKLAQDPLSVLSEAGISYDQLTAAILNSPKPENLEQVRALNELREELRAIKEAQSKALENQQKAQEESYKQALGQITKDAERLVSANPEFETVREMKRTKDVVRLIERTFNEEGYVMDVEEAARLIENELVDRIVKATKIKKISSKISPVAPATPQKTLEAPKQEQKQTQPMKTLTNAVGTNRRLSARERAILAFKGELPK